MATWSPKDKAAEEADELSSGAMMGLSANQREFLSEDYTGPSWNAFTEAWTWLKSKLHGKAH